jgi:hypothetical protein
MQSNMPRRTIQEVLGANRPAKALIKHPSRPEIIR